MLHMKKNTKAKVGTLAATGFALASVLGLVQQGATTSSSGESVSTTQSAAIWRATSSPSSSLHVLSGTGFSLCLSDGLNSPIFRFDAGTIPRRYFS